MKRISRLATSALALALAAAPVAVAAAKGGPARDPKIDKLAKAALSCKFEDGSFDAECPAYKAWTENEPLFAEGKGDMTVVALFEDADPKIRYLASEKGFTERKVLEDKAVVQRLIAVVKKETEFPIGRSLVNYLVGPDLEAMGLGEEWRAMAKLPLSEVRGSVGFNLYSRHQTPLTFEITKQLLSDSDPKVAISAVTGLSMGAQRGKKPEACKLLGEQIKRTDGVAGDAHWHAATSECTSIFDALAASLKTRMSQAPAREKDGVTYGLAIGALCHDKSATPAQRKSAFEAAKLLTSAATKNPNSRTAGMSPLWECDKAASKPILEALAKDKDKFVAERAAKELANASK